MTQPFAPLSDDLHNLLENLTSGAVVVNGHGGILYANPAFLALIGKAESPPAPLSLATLLKFPVKTDCALCMGVSQSDNPQWATFHGASLCIQSEKGTPEELRVKIKHSPLGEGRGAGRILCLVDPFSEDTTLTQAHSDFVSTVSHEFRTPLTSIKGFADTLLNYGAQLPEEEKRRFITIIKDQADRLIRLVENLLTASKLGASRVDLTCRSIPLRKTLERVAQGIRIKVQAKTGADRSIEVRVTPEDLEVWADADRLEQVLINLIDNAVKYSPQTSTVHVSAERLPDPDGDADEDHRTNASVRIVVQDEGVGIPEALLPKIFTKFYRVESPLKQDVEGTGLGLYIAKSLVTAMNGRIFAESLPGEGSTFTVILPASVSDRQSTRHGKGLPAGEDA